MKHLDVVVPTRLLEDVGILTELFFHNNESVDVLQSFAVRPHVLAFVVRVRRRGPFKDLEAIRREARALVRRYRLARFELMSASRERGEYVAWIEWKIPEAVEEAFGKEGGDASNADVIVVAVPSSPKASSADSGASWTGSGGTTGCGPSGEFPRGDGIRGPHSRFDSENC